MFKPQSCRSSSSRREERRSTPDILISDTDERFFQSLYEIIEHEKRYLRCPEEGPSEQRHSIYCSVFNKVISRATAYKRLLLTIKAEYDDAIRELKRREDEARMTQRTLAALTSNLKSLTSCQRRAAQLRDRVSALHRETAELQEELKTQRLSVEQSTWIPGLTVAESLDPEALDGHLKHLEAQRSALLDRKRHCVSLEVKAELDDMLQATAHHRDQLSTENNRLKALYKRLRLVCDRLSSWEEEGAQAPLEELLCATLESIRQSKVTEDTSCSIDAELFGGEEPTGVDEFRLLTDYLDRFIELFDSAQYEDAALLAARSPRGVLRNLDTMQMFTGVKGPPGSVPPVLLFFQALLITAPAGDELSAPLSLQAVRFALQHGASQLVTHAVTQKKLNFSEDLGDILTEHAQKNPGVTDLCLALATIVYEACGLDRKTALSMCKRGLIHSAIEFMNHCKNLTAEDCVWILYRSPSLSLLQLLTEPQRGQAAILSAGIACSTLLSDPRQQQFALQLLDSFVSRGRGFGGGDPGGLQLLSRRLGQRSVSVLPAGPSRPEPGHPVSPARPEWDQPAVPGPGGSLAYGTCLPVKTASDRSLASRTIRAKQVQTAARSQFLLLLFVTGLN